MQKIQCNLCYLTGHLVHSWNTKQQILVELLYVHTLLRCCMFGWLRNILSSTKMKISGFTGPPQPFHSGPVSSLLSDYFQLFMIKQEYIYNIKILKTLYVCLALVKKFIELLIFCSIGISN